jgi:hypothetical protein
MRQVLAFVLFAVLMLPAAATAQQWSAEQQEVWEFELGCQVSKEAFLECFHEDYVAWGNGSLGVPTNRADMLEIGGRRWDENEIVFLHMKPLSIDVRGDMAVVLVIYTVTERNRETGAISTSIERWTDICLKEDGQWYWIADHGSPIGGS